MIFACTEPAGGLLHGLVVQGLVPGLLVLGALVTWLVAALEPPGEPRRAAYFGSCAGALAAVLYSIAITRGATELPLPSPFVAGVVGLAIGVVAPVLFLILRGSWAVGLLCLLQVFGSLALLSTLYVLHDPDAATAAASLAVSDAFGACLVLLSPRRGLERFAAAVRQRASIGRSRRPSSRGRPGGGDP